MQLGLQSKLDLLLVDDSSLFAVKDRFLAVQSLNAVTLCFRLAACLMAGLSGRETPVPSGYLANLRREKKEPLLM